MSNATQRNFGAAQRERDRRVAASLEGELPIGSLAVTGDPGWDAFFGSLHDKADAAGRAGMGFRADLSGIGRFAEPTQGGGRLTPTDEAGIAGNIGLGQLADSSAIRQLALKRAADQQRDAAVDDMTRSYQEHVLNSIGQPREEGSATTEHVGPDGKVSYSITPSGPDTRSDRQRMLDRLPGALRAIVEPTLTPLEQRDRALTEQERHAKEAEETARIAAGEGDANVKDAVSGMKEGTLPPILPGRATKDYVKILAEAKAQGYDLVGAAQDWTATQKHIASLNSTQQLRLNQSINQLPELLDSVESLAKQWKANAGVPLLNKANLLAAKNGAFGTEAASLANKLTTQIADVNADLGTVYMGGNSPTDHALKLASTALNEDWDEKVLTDMVGLARNNVKIRQNSIRNTGVAGASANNPYDRSGAAPPAAAPPVAAPSGGTNPFRKK